MTSTLSKDVYNLEFPSWIDELSIGGYRFIRRSDYRNRHAKLQHLIAVHSELRSVPNNGENVITARVEGRRNEKSVIFAGTPGKEALDDVLLLLSLFTQRTVFAVEPDTEGVVVADPRFSRRGGILRCSIPYKAAGAGKPGNVAFAESLDAICSLIRDPGWRQKYDSGHFVALATQAFRPQPLEGTFAQCWTIWEHLFATMTRAWLSEEMLRHLHALDKIAFILHTFALRPNVSKKDGEKIRSLAGIRNSLIHNGRFPERETVYDEAELFCQITEFVIARIFGLGPSNLFNTIEKFEAFLASEQKSAEKPAGRGASRGKRS